MWQRRLRCTAAAHRDTEHMYTITPAWQKKLNQCQYYHKNMGCTALFHLHMPPKAWKTTVTSVKRYPNAHHLERMYVCIYIYIHIWKPIYIYIYLAFIQIHKKGSSNPSTVQWCLALQWSTHAAGPLLHTGKGKTERAPWKALHRHFLASFSS